MSVDDVVAGLASVRDEQLMLEGDRELLRAILDAERPADTPAPRRRPRFRLMLGAALATAAVATAPVAVHIAGDGPARGRAPVNSPADPAVVVGKKDDAYVADIRDAFTAQREFQEAFARFNLNARLFVVPASPGGEGRVIGRGTLAGPNAPRDRNLTISVTSCPKSGSTCPMRVRVTEPLPGDRLFVMLGRKALPGEPYADTIYSHSGRRSVAWMRSLEGRDLGEVLRRVHGKGLKAHYAIGREQSDGTVMTWYPSLEWEPSGDRRVMQVWPYSPGAVVILVEKRSGDPTESDLARMDPYQVNEYVTGR
ncbi:hypothetical protein ACSNOI_04865 [Actinomadura kijaniata]|uniref:hypothetical protein n=1 Tax=Actinomadura kijaniata TaxID=46161 RepID=UPI003F1BE165